MQNWFKGVKSMAVKINEQLKTLTVKSKNNTMGTDVNSLFKRIIDIIFFALLREVKAMGDSSTPTGFIGRVMRRCEKETACHSSR